MSSEEAREFETNPGAEALYEDLKRRQARGDKVTLEEYCKKHPQQAEALRWLDSIQRDPLWTGPSEKKMDPSQPIFFPTPANPEPFFRPAFAGSGHPARIGSYTIVRVLGEGGMGTVFLAEQVEPLRRKVALKLIKFGMDILDVIGRFEAERQALALLDHPHIAKVYEAGAMEDGRPYFTMEYVNGLPLTEYCDRERLGVKEGRAREITA